MNTKSNQRFHETEIRMKAAMLNLMKNNDFEKITVKKYVKKLMFIPKLSIPIG